MASYFLQKVFLGNTGQDWLTSLSIILGVIIVGKLLYWLFGNVIKKLTSKTKTKLDDIIIDMIEEPIVFAIILGGIRYSLGLLTFTETVGRWVNTIFGMLIVMNIAWLITRLFDSLLKEYIVPLTENSETDLDDQLLPILSKGTKAIVWILAVIIALNNAGYDVGALLAGVGIGGLAFAMAAKDTVANIFGGFTILTDKPFKIKDRVRISGFDGTIKEIGIRSTRLQTLEGRMVTIPNSTFSENPVENVSREPTRKIILDIGLVYDTTSQQMDKAMKLLDGIAKKNKHVNDKYIVAFDTFGDSAMMIKFIYYIRKGSNIFDTKSEINFEILKQFGKNKLDMAFPTQTIYTKKG